MVLFRTTSGDIIQKFFTKKLHELHVVDYENYFKQFGFQGPLGFSAVLFHILLTLWACVINMHLYLCKPHNALVEAH